MRYKLGLENITGKKVTAIVYDINLNEKEAKSKVLILANSIAEKGGSKVLSSTSPYKIVSIESCEPKGNKVKDLNGNKQYGALVIGDCYKTFEDKVIGVGGEMSAYNRIMRFLRPSWSKSIPGVIVYLLDLGNIKKPEVDANGNIKLTIAEAISDNRVSFKEFYSVLQDAGLTDEDVLNSTEIIEQYIKEKVAEDIDVFHIMKALREGSDTDLWRIWLGNSMETPEPIETKKDLMEVVEDSMSFDEEKDYKRRFVFNIRNR